VASNDLSLSILKQIQAGLSDVKHEQLSMGVRMASMEQHLAANQVEIARISGDVAQMKSDIAFIKRRLNLVDA
jgi:hypothetical protein